MVDCIVVVGMFGNVVDDLEGMLCGEFVLLGGYLINSEVLFVCLNLFYVGSWVCCCGLCILVVGMC